LGMSQTDVFEFIQNRNVQLLKNNNCAKMLIRSTNYFRVVVV